MGLIVLLMTWLTVVSVDSGAWLVVVVVVVGLETGLVWLVVLATTCSVTRCFATCPRKSDVRDTGDSGA